MAKVSFAKLGLSKNQEIKTIEYNGQSIEVRQYLPINDKLALISDVINLSNDNNFANPVKSSVYMLLGVVQYYTNINFTEKQKEDPTKLYDLLEGSGLLQQIIDAIPEDEYTEVAFGTQNSIKAFYDYKNSVLGILESISTDYSNLDLDASNIQQKLADPANMELLKGIMAKLG